MDKQEESRGWERCGQVIQQLFNILCVFMLECEILSLCEIEKCPSHLLKHFTPTARRLLLTNIHWNVLARVVQWTTYSTKFVPVHKIFHTFKIHICQKHFSLYWHATYSIYDCKIFILFPTLGLVCTLTLYRNFHILTYFIRVLTSLALLDYCIIEFCCSLLLLQCCQTKLVFLYNQIRYCL